MSHTDPTLPDVGNGDAPCCYGSAHSGPAGCTCWRDEYDQPQAAVRPGKPATRTSMCGDCAFRPASPERSGDARYEHSGDGDVEDLAFGSGTFACHQGMRRRLAQFHPSGARHPSGPGDYVPRVAAGVAYKADGTPADICAGFAAARSRAAK